MRVRWTPIARDDFAQRTAYIAADSPKGARLVASRVRTATRQLAQAPLSGRPGRVFGTRELVVPRTPFTLDYRVVEETIVIVGAMHQAQDWPDTFS